jgi:hypothetical protein
MHGRALVPALGEVGLAPDHLAERRDCLAVAAGLHLVHAACHQPVDLVVARARPQQPQSLLGESPHERTFVVQALEQQRLVVDAPWLASQTTPSARFSVCGSSRAASASARDAGAGNASGAPTVRVAASTKRRTSDENRGPACLDDSFFRRAAGAGSSGRLAASRRCAGRPVVERALRANAEKDWARSQSILRDALLKDPRNADYHNLYAYSVRKGESRTSTSCSSTTTRRCGSTRSIAARTSTSARRT